MTDASVGLSNPNNTMTKTQRDKTKRIFAAALKPPEAIAKDEGSEPELNIIYVTATGQERRHRCSSEAFRRVSGRRQNNREHSGLDMQTGRAYILHTDAVTNLVTHIDDYPVAGALHRMKPADAETNNELVISVLADGTLHVKGRPFGVSDQALQRVCETIDKKAEIEVGEEWHGFRVANIVGSTLHLTIEDEEATSMQVGVSVE